MKGFLNCFLIAIFSYIRYNSKGAYTKQSHTKQSKGHDSEKKTVPYKTFHVSFQTVKDYQADCRFKGDNHTYKSNICIESYLLLAGSQHVMGIK